MRWKQSAEITTDKSHRVYYNGRGDAKHKQCVGFLNIRVLRKVKDKQ